MIFYNTSLSGMLADTETFLKKMRYVFQCFEGREDVCLLWRPHPLLESTFDSMRPQYRQDYDELKTMFLDHDLGILDTMPDIDESVALSDAYIGGGGTSVTALFGIVGKPMFILNSKILRKPDAGSWRDKIDFRLNYLVQDKFIITQNNELYVSESEQYDYHYFCDLSEYVDRKEYSAILQIEGKKYACPANAQDILKIGNNGIEKKIVLEKTAITGRMFIDGWMDDRFLILHPLNYPAIVRFDTVTEECAYFRDKLNVFVKNKANQKISGASLVCRGILYITSPVDNMVYRLNIESGEEQLLTIPIKSRCGCSALAEYMNQIWLLPYDGETIVSWNPQTGEAKEYTGFPKELVCTGAGNDQQCKELLFNSMAFYGNYVYLTPWRANMYLRLNMNTGHFEKWTPPFEDKIDQKKLIKCIFLKERTEDERGWIKMYSNVNKRLYHLNLKTNEYKEIEFNFDINELDNHAHVQGFGECSRTLKYACQENVFNSLDRFIDGTTMGNSFDKKKQLQVYGEAAANSDASCGRRIYEYVKVQR